jgi:hypothetical protein
MALPRRFLAGLFIFEEEAMKRGRSLSTNTLIIKDVQIHSEAHDGTRIAILRPVCPLKIMRNHTEAKSGAKWPGEPLFIFR